VPADKDVLGFVLQDLRFSLERLNGEGVYSQGSHYPCFTGRFRWSISRRGIGSVNHRLIAFMLGWMQVAGTGTKTAMGFGQLEVTIV
jgi:CRISPR/Cas system endoribonuclease Cas6 (RAMP superfamily)